MPTVAPSRPPRSSLRRALLLAVPLLVACAVACTPPPPPPPTEGEARDTVVSIEGFVTDRLTSGALTQRIMAREATYNESQRLAFLDNVKIEFFDGDSDGTELDATLWADSAILYLDDRPTSNALQNDIDLWGSVQYRVVENDNTMMTSQLRWNDQEEWNGEVGVLRSDAHFRKLLFTSPEQVMVFEGEGFIANRKLTNWKYTRSQIKSEAVTPERVDSLRPTPRADAPEYSGRP